MTRTGALPPGARPRPGSGLAVSAEPVEDDGGHPGDGLVRRLSRADVGLDRHEQRHVLGPDVVPQVAIGLRLPGQGRDGVPQSGADACEPRIGLNLSVQAGLERGCQRAQPAADALAKEAAQRRPGPAFLAASRLQASDDLYFDAVSQVRLPRWSRGRVAVVGDAASCLSLFGDGSTLAMAGAYTLAQQLGEWSHGDEGSPQPALDRYETAHRAVVEPKLNGYRLGAAMLLPATRLGILTRNALARAMPVLSAASSPRRKNAPA
jgi:2-polyprenyl-6-methoxyphenol hydroxylase-like FAD-dependent oxidoreductase